MKRIDEVTRVDSCLNKAGDQEPVFVLRANDPIAADIVRFWASKYMAFKFGENYETTGKAGLTDKQRAKYNEARQLAEEMDVWLAAQLKAEAALHTRRIVTHVSGWQEPMNTCTCGAQWPCPKAV